jgi:hypothetical protein
VDNLQVKPFAPGLVTPAGREMIFRDWMLSLKDVLLLAPTLGYEDKLSKRYFI